MAFKIIRKNSRQAAPDSDNGITEVTDAGSEQSSTGKHVLATQGWVYHVLRGIWDWTRHFTTESLKVAGMIKAEGVQSTEVQACDIYTRRLTLLDNDGNPVGIYIDDDGELKIDRQFRQVFVYPGPNLNELKYFVYRNTHDVASNFAGMTPYDTYLNFVPFNIGPTKEFNGKICPCLCPADGKNELVGYTLLFTCKETKKIVSLKILDGDGNAVNTFELPEGKNWRKLTINMPMFKYTKDGEEKTAKVRLPGTESDSLTDNYRMFLPPFLTPPPFPCPFIGPPKMDENIFNEGTFIEDDIFKDLDGESETEEDGGEDSESIKPNYEALYQDFDGSTYYNIALRKSDLEKNKEQYLAVEIVDA